MKLVAFFVAGAWMLLSSYPSFSLRMNGKLHPRVLSVSTTKIFSATGGPIITAGMGKSSLIQIAFSYDTTGSMTPCIKNVKSTIQTTLTRLFAAIPNIEVAIIAHGDYCDEETSYLLKYIDFTSDLTSLCNFVSNVESTGGGDFDEAYEYMLNKARTALSWRDLSSQKSLVMIGDATPHKPDYPLNRLKLEWKQEARMLRDRNIRVYAVRCLAFPESVSFFKTVATITNGFYLPLAQFDAITDFMVAISLHESGTEQLQEFRQEVQSRPGAYTRSMSQMFVALGVEKAEPPPTISDLVPVEPGRFQILAVEADQSIREFVVSTGAVFERGAGFYEFNKPETIGEKKKVVLVHKSTGDMYTGNRAKELAGIGISESIKGKVKPPPSDTWQMFIQSTSYNRKLISGTKFLYEASKFSAPASDDSD